MFETILLPVLIAFLLECVLSIGLVGLFHNRIRNFLNQKALKVKIYERGRNMKALNRCLASSAHICVIAHTARNFTYDAYGILSDKIKKGVNIKFLVANAASDYIADINRVQALADGHTAAEIAETCELLRQLYEQNPDNPSKIEVRSYNTEMRNPMVLCGDENKSIEAWVTVMIPAKRPVDCLSIQCGKEASQDCYDSFLRIWELHEEDVLLKLPEL